MSTIILAANNGEIGGGEVMLLATAALLAELGRDVEVVGPQVPEGILDLCESQGFTVHRLAPDRRGYLHDLRSWHGSRRDLLWCHGLVPAFATAGRGRRIIHLHQLPSRAQRAGYLAARSGSWLTLVPSRWMADRVPGARVLPNWTADLGYVAPVPASPRRLGYLGRHSIGKGLLTLAEALTSVDHLDRSAGVRLVLAGEARFTDEAGASQVAAAIDALGDVVERVGWVERAALLRSVDGLVVPSVAPESFGLAAAEAMSAGVPCLVSDAGALPEVIGPPQQWVHEAGSSTSLADSVKAWARAEPEDLTAIAHAHRSRWEREYAPAIARERVRALLATLPT